MKKLKEKIYQQIQAKQTKIKKKRINTKIILLGILFIILGCGLWSINIQAAEQPLQKKVMILIFNPIIESRGNQRLINVFGWNNPDTLTQTYINDVKEVSGQIVQYSIVERLEVDDFPVLNDGFHYTDQTYLTAWETGNWHNPWLVDYKAILTTYGVCEKLNRGDIDELWLFGAPGMGFWESTLAGPGAFWYNSPPITGTDCKKLLPIMGFSYERGVDCMLEDLGHRTEATMTQVYGGWNPVSGTTPWDMFTMYDKITPGKAQCGNVHYAPNSLSDYDWSNTRSVPSASDDWYTYPNLPGNYRTFNCLEWGGDGYGYKKWWLRHLPKNSGQNQGKWNNWWRYVVDYENNIALPQAQQFICSAPVDQGIISASMLSGIIPIPPNGVIEVNVGETVLFYESGNSGYEPAGFKFNGQPRGETFFNYTVNNVEAPITIEALFRPVRDAVAVHPKILSPAKGCITLIGVTPAVSISGTIDDSTVNVIEIYKNDGYLVQANVNTEGAWQFSNLALDVGDNIFMVKAIDSSGNIGVDFILVHYSPDPVSNVKAVMFIDRRLYNQAQIADKLNQYITASEEQLGEDYKIFLDVVDGIDDWTTNEVRNHMLRLKNNHLFLEGVLFIGNIKLPSFYSPRGDTLSSKLITHKYEDLDIVLNKNNSSVRTDYDYMAKGRNPFPELWNSYIPVGFNGDASKNKYSDFATQVLKFLDKALEQRKGLKKYTKLYKVSNQLWDMGGITNEYGLSGIDFYGVNDTDYGPYQYCNPSLVTPELFYKKAAFEKFNSYNELSSYHYRFPWMGENWQKDYVFINHMQSKHYAMAWINTHACEDWTLISTSQAKSLTSGGLILMASGCDVAGFKQYGSMSYNEAYTTPDSNILCGFVYGNSDFLAAFGDPFTRVDEPEFNRLATFVAQGDYLGLAHFFRKCYQYHRSGSNADIFKGATQEMLIGDPFLVFTVGSALPPNVPSDLVATAVSSAQINLSWQDNSNNENGFMIERLCNSPWPTIIAPQFEEIAVVEANVTTYIDNKLTPGTTYIYRVRAYNRSGNSDYSNEANATTPDATPPTIPIVTDEGDFTTSNNQLYAAWKSSDPESGISEYQYQILDGGGGSGEFPGPTVIRVIRDWTSTGTNDYVTAGGFNLRYGITYYFLVKAKNGAGLWSEAGYSDGITVNRPPEIEPMKDQEITEGQLLEFMVSASDPDGNLTELKALNLPKGAKFEILAQHTDTDIRPNPSGIQGRFTWTPDYIQTGEYKVIFSASDGQLSDEEPIAIVVNGYNPLPLSPSDLTAQALSSTQITLQWKDNSNNEEGFRIERFYNPPPGMGIMSRFVEIAVAKANVTNYIDNGLTPGETYTYRVRAYNSVGDSEYSNEANATVPPAALPDLISINIKFYKPQSEEIPQNEVTPIIGQLVTCKAILKNQGDSPTDVFNVKWFLDGVQVGYGSHETLEAGQTSNGNVRFDWTPTTKGKHTLTFASDCDNHVKESNEDNNSYAKTVSINPNNKPPIAKITASPTLGYFLIKVQFRGNKSYDPDGKIISYRWSFGDGGSSNQINPVHIYNNNTSKTKIYNATLVVTDNQGLSSAGRISITVYPKRK